MKSALIERIADGRTDLVLEHLAGGGAAGAADVGGVRLVQWCAYYGDVSALRVLVSVDGSSDGGRCREACEPFAADPRFRIVAQPRRLGWVGNCNWLIGRVETPFFALLPHDDLLHERYVERLLGELRSRPRADGAPSPRRRAAPVGRRCARRA